jgi:hypothetical protein
VDDVKEKLVIAGVKFSASEQARKQLGIVELELPRTGATWLRLPNKKATTVVKQ